MQEATLWIVPLLLTAAVAVLWLYASMAIFVGSVGLALTIRSAQYTYTSVLSLCTGIGVLTLLVANAQLLREALIETSPPTNGH